MFITQLPDLNQYYIFYLMPLGIMPYCIYNPHFVSYVSVHFHVVGKAIDVKTFFYYHNNSSLPLGPPANE